MNQNSLGHSRAVQIWVCSFSLILHANLKDHTVWRNRKITIKNLSCHMLRTITFLVFIKICYNRKKKNPSMVFQGLLLDTYKKNLKMQANLLINFVLEQTSSADSPVKRMRWHLAGPLPVWMGRRFCWSNWYHTSSMSTAYNIIHIQNSLFFSLRLRVNRSQVQITA